MSSDLKQPDKNPVISEPGGRTWPTFRLMHLMLLVLGSAVACWLLGPTVLALGPLALLLILFFVGVVAMEC